MSEITVKTEFKSCPFCSSENIKVEQMEQDNGINVWVCWCGNCGSLGPTHLNWSGAIEMWNLRRSQKSLVTELNDVKGFLDIIYSEDIVSSEELRSIYEKVENLIIQVEGDQS